MTSPTPDPHDPSERLAAFRKNVADEAFLAALNAALGNVTLPVASATAGVDALPLVYIVGAPRSGTTLLSQLLSRSLSVGYINNLVARFWSRPSVGIRLSQMLLVDGGRADIRFDSRHGVSSGVGGPHEFGRFWRTWLSLDRAPTHHPTRAQLDALDADGLRRALRCEILAQFNGPVLFKNVICGFHASWLSQVHPTSLFVNIERDLAATCASVLAARRERYGSYAAWWSLKPSTFADIAAISDPSTQVVRQVVDCRREMRVALSEGNVRAVTVSYEDLCRTPAHVVDQVCEAVRAFGAELGRIHHIPASFRLSKGAAVPSEIRAALHRALATVLP